MFAAITLIASAYASAAATLPQSASAGVETEPTLQLSDFAAPPPASGKGYRIDPKVPVAGYLGQFAMHTDLGDMKVEGSGLLKQRIAEVGPSIELQKMSKSKVFVDALGSSAENSAKAVGRAVAHPVDTVAGIPAGVGRLFTSIGKTASSTTSGDTAGAASEALGVNEAKREIAKNVGIDPYTTNPQLSGRLDDLAEAAVAGGISLNVAMSVATAGVATAISATATISNLAWDLPPEDIRARNDKELAALTVDEAPREKFLNNRWYTPTMAISFVDALKELGVHDDANALVALSANAASEVEARFFIAQLRLAQSYAKGGDAIVSIGTVGDVGAFRTASGKLLLPAPVDYLSWDEGVKSLVESNNAATGEHLVWLTGKASPMATAQLRAKGWSLRERVPQD